VSGLRPEWITVQVCVAWLDRSDRQIFSVPVGSTIGDIEQHPDLSAELRAAWQSASGIGIFGQAESLDKALVDGDRIELWRPLIADPKDARRQRAKLKLEERKKARLIAKTRRRRGQTD
jgi:putative ubiquitin-RnfH superfamily antitoxin RatB of RatAB toxin-antitoxin module